MTSCPSYLIFLIPSRPLSLLPPFTRTHTHTHHVQIIVDKANHTWTLYDAGPRHVRSPLVCLPPVCGTADVFFRQLLDLTAVGYRVISVGMIQQPPVPVFNTHPTTLFSYVYMCIYCHRGWTKSIIILLLSPNRYFPTYRALFAPGGV